MEERSPATMERIQQAALEEFSEKGFLGASLRQIVKNAGVTTGAFYGYFSSKEALFASLVEPHAAALMGRFMEAQTSFADLAEEEQPKHMGEASGDYVDWMVDYICQHREPVKLLLCRAEGTSYEHFAHNMVEIEVEYTLKYMEVLRRLGKNIPDLSPSLCHIIASGMFNGLFEIVVHDMPREQARLYVAQFRAFYTAGWLKLMVYLHLAGGARPHRRGAGLDGGAECGPLRLAGLCLCHGRHRRLFCGADVHTPCGVPHGGQHPKAGCGACDESASWVF